MNYRPSSDFALRSNLKAEDKRLTYSLDEVLRPYAEGARARELGEGIKPMCITCGKVKTITNDFAICWDCARERKGGDMSE